MAEANEKAMIELRDYQKKAIDDVFEYICNKSGNPVVIAPTGSGKSILIAEIIRRSLKWWPGTRILMLTHQKELIEQDMDKLKKIAPELDMGVYSASLKSKDALRSFCSISFALSASISASAFSMSVSTSPIPRILDAIRSG